jgi:hypothetical protein
MDVQLGARIDRKIKQAIQSVCKEKGLKLSRFVEDALIDKLEEMVDASEVAKLRREPSRPLGEVLEALGIDARV